MPHYVIQEFISACLDADNIIVLKQAKIDAEQIFKLKSVKEIAAFIYEGGLMNLSFVNSKPWENNSDKTKTIIVDGYKFTTMNMSSYIAFLRPIDKWIIKSLHLSNDRNPVMMIALQKAGFLPEGDFDVKR